MNVVTHQKACSNSTKPTVFRKSIAALECQRRTVSRSTDQGELPDQQLTASDECSPPDPHHSVCTCDSHDFHLIRVETLYKRPQLFSMKHAAATECSVSGIDGGSMKTEGPPSIQNDITESNEESNVMSPDYQSAGSYREAETETTAGIELWNDESLQDFKSRDLAKAGESGNEDEWVAPNLLQYNFQAIYKKNGLQFDERWREQMIERYLLMKLQKKQRQDAATYRRIYQEQERQFGIIVSNPDLIPKVESPWLEDPEALAKYILNSARIVGRLKSRGCPLYGRAKSAEPSTASRMHRTYVHVPNPGRLTEDAGEGKSGYRFNIRPKTATVSKNIHAFSMCSKSEVTVTARSSSAYRKPSAIERPRSSSSIPGKTRYVLLKSESDRHMLPPSPTPSKLEERYLRERFPVQYLMLRKSLGYFDEEQMDSPSVDFCEAHKKTESRSCACASSMSQPPCVKRTYQKSSFWQPIVSARASPVQRK